MAMGGTFGAMTLSVLRLTSGNRVRVQQFKGRITSSLSPNNLRIYSLRLLLDPLQLARYFPTK